MTGAGTIRCVTPLSASEAGKELIFAVDFTAGGAPIGLTEEESREIEMKMSPDAGWVIARNALELAARAHGEQDSRRTVGYVRFLGRGISNEVYGAEVTLADGTSAELVVKLPARECPTERDVSIRREANLLRYLAELNLAFRVPRAFGEVSTPIGLAAVQGWAYGAPVDLRADRFRGGRPWELVGRLAAAIHNVDPTRLRGLLGGDSTWREHATAFARVLDDVGPPESNDAQSWIAQHLPAAEPARLLHGDLLGHNLRVPWEDEAPVVLDWGEARLGDPAYDLAIVTRGVRRPFGKDDGLRRLVDDYNLHATRPLTIAAVQLHEILLVAKLYMDVVREYGAEAPRAQADRQVFRSLLRRVFANEDANAT